MGDFWGVERIFPNEDVHKGISVLLVNTLKGQEILNKMNKYLRLVEVDKDYVIEANAQLNHPAHLHPKRDLFFELLGVDSFDEIINKCIPKPSIIRRLVSKILPLKWKKFIKKIIKEGMILK